MSLESCARKFQRSGAAWEIPQTVFSVIRHAKHDPLNFPAQTRHSLKTIGFYWLMRKAVCETCVSSVPRVEAAGNAARTWRALPQPGTSLRGHFGSSESRGT